MNVILGGGLIGCLARHVLGDGWVLIPHGVSRFYHFFPLADNFIRVSDSISDVMGGLCSSGAVIFYKSPFSCAGQLIYNDAFAGDYVLKVYGDHPYASKIIKTSFAVYDVRCSDLYKSFKSRFIKSNDFGKVVSVDFKERVVRCEKRVVGYDRLINTLPLDVFCSYCGVNMDISARDVYYYWIRSDKIDIEGAGTVLVCDSDIDFFKVYRLDGNNYVFCTFEPLENPSKYFGLFIGFNFDLVESIKVSNVIPIGVPPDLSFLDDFGVTCIGSNARWDDLVDVTTCISNIIKMA